MNKVSPVWVSLSFVHQHPAWESHLPSQGTAANQGWPVRCKSLTQWVLVFGLIFFFLLLVRIYHTSTLRRAQPHCAAFRRGTWGATTCAPKGS